MQEDKTAKSPGAAREKLEISPFDAWMDVLATLDAEVRHRLDRLDEACENVPLHMVNVHIGMHMLQERGQEVHEEIDLFRSEALARHEEMVKGKVRRIGLLPYEDVREEDYAGIVRMLDEVIGRAESQLVDEAKQIYAEAHVFMIMCDKTLADAYGSYLRVIK